MAGLRWNGVNGDPFCSVEWERRTAEIPGVFKQPDVEVPKSWSDRALNIAAEKYFRGHIGKPSRENSIRQLIGRVVRRIEEWAIKGQYFRYSAERKGFISDLTTVLLHQEAAFNSPVWFNLGADDRRQAASACYIISVKDSMESILDLCKTEGMLFKDGSGSGSNLSTLRASCEELSSGGTASGPVSFMRGLDSFAGVIKSGGSVRRAAKMVLLNADHPDILEFIRCKAHEEKKAYALIAAGFDGSFNGEAYATIAFQNANNSVRATDHFMQAIENDEDWTLRRVTDGAQAGSVKARTLMREIAEATYLCGDPGFQFHDTINRWHTSATTGQINASNPCGEFVFLDDTACNLASINLKKFLDANGEFDIVRFRHVVRTMITAQEILVGFAKYPTKKVTKNSHDFRPLGLGYTNIGALLMLKGLPYDSDEGRTYAASITALMTGEAYQQSAVIARDCDEPFAGYGENKRHCDKVVRMHADAAAQLPDNPVSSAAVKAWGHAMVVGDAHGYRNAQVTVIAPTGTIGFMMDCDTTGIEPDYGLVKHKHLVGGGTIQIVNTSVKPALLTIGYSQQEAEDITKYVLSHDTIEGAPHIKPEHLPVFDCANTAGKGVRSIAPEGHLRMVGAVQPFVSGAISKTINLPEQATVEDIEAAYMLAWKLGIKAVSVYRDKSKRAQPLNTDGSESTAPPSRPFRRRLPDERQAITHRFEIAGQHKGYVTVGLFEDGSPGEIFITLSKNGSTISGMADAFAQAISFSLQYGVPLLTLVDKFSHIRFEPSGITKNEDIRFAHSVVDYIFRWMGQRFAGAHSRAPQPEGAAGAPTAIDTPPCPACGALMARSGSCYTCPVCGESGGCG